MESLGLISPGQAEDYKDQNYNMVKTQFEDMGFKNIELIELDDEEIFSNKVDTVSLVSIKGNVSFGKDDYFSANDRVVISYH